jgi:hypothetical protein
MLEIGRLRTTSISLGAFTYLYLLSSRIRAVMGEVGKSEVEIRQLFINRGTGIGHKRSGRGRVKHVITIPFRAKNLNPSGRGLASVCWWTRQLVTTVSTPPAGGLVTTTTLPTVKRRTAYLPFQLRFTALNSPLRMGSRDRVPGKLRLISISPAAIDISHALLSVRRSRIPV